VRFAVQVLAAAAVVGSRAEAIPLGFGSPLGHLPAWILAPLLVVWIVWVTNLYNFMDGIDGLAGGQTVLAALAIGVSAHALGAGLTGALAFALAGAALGFLTFNFPPASIFMGDVGSTAIGFFLASVPLMPEAHPVPLEAVALAIALFGLDATITLVRRVLRGERWFEAHRTHYYQRPLACGVGHRRITAVAWSAIALSSAVSALYVRVNEPTRIVLFVVPVASFAVLAVAVHRLETRTAAAHRARTAAPEADRGGTRASAG
jgi:UDP-N-acetylmuramyl pentapeptide phosphotransferase/UDP-N-acetylglucosamine-1-phosphate transferase